MKRTTKKMHRKLMAVLILILIVITGCTARGADPAALPDSSEGDDATQIVIGLLFPSLYNANYVLIQSGAVESASRQDIELIVRDAVNSSSTQLDQVQEVLDLGVDALILIPVDTTTVNSAAGIASARGVPVITVERRLSSTDVVTHISSDNVTGGEMAAAFIADQLDEQGQVVELTGLPSASTAQDRMAGFAEVIDNYPEIIMVSSTTADFQKQTAKRLFGDMLRHNPGIDAVFAHNDEMALGAVEAAEEAGLRDIVFVGFDATDEAISAIEEGRLTATVAQQSTEMGRLAVETALEYLNGETVPEQITVDLALITR